MAEMGLHPSSRTNREMRREIQRSNDSIEGIARKLGINPKTARKWKRRVSVEDAPSVGPPKGPRALRPYEESVILDFRKRSNLPLGECHFFLKELFPWLSRSTLYRCFLRNGVGRIADTAWRISRRELSDLFYECCERAFKVWQEMNPGCDIMPTLRQCYGAMSARLARHLSRYPSHPNPATLCNPIPHQNGGKGSP